MVMCSEPVMRTPLRGFCFAYFFLGCFSGYDWTFCCFLLCGLSVFLVYVIIAMGLAFHCNIVQRFASRGITLSHFIA
jgi:hypothetical protein